MLTSSAQLAAIFKQGKRLEYSRGEFIVRPGEDLVGLFFIESGLVKSYNYTKFGEENLLALRRDGDIIGLTASITGNKLDIMYTALANTTLWHLSQSKFLSNLEGNPKFGLAVIAILAEMYRLHSEHILNLEYRSVRERLIAFLLVIRGRFGRKLNGAIVIEVPLRHQDIASYINASRETTSRELNALQRKGLIEFSQNLIILKKLDKLQAYLEA